MYVISMTLESYNTKLTVDAARFCFYFLYFLLHSQSSLLLLLLLNNRACLAIDVVLWFIRLFILLMIDRTVGPMLLMIQAMVGMCTSFEHCHHYMNMGSS
jgi:hypothetical protein